MLSRTLLVMLCLAAAVASYAMGIHAGIVVFVLLAVTFELVFWVLITKRTGTKIVKTG